MRLSSCLLCRLSSFGFEFGMVHDGAKWRIEFGFEFVEISIRVTALKIVHGGLCRTHDGLEMSQMVLK